MYTITIYQKENSRGQAKNPNGYTKAFTVQQGDTATLSMAVSFDNCPAKYKDGYRKTENFIQADCILADIDNSHSDIPTEWITEKDVEKALQGISFYWYPSRNDMKAKNGKAPRPKRHFIFPINMVKAANEYTAHMKWLIESFPNLHFDKAVKGASQLNFGVENADVHYINGTMNLSEFIKSYCKISESIKLYNCEVREKMTSAYNSNNIITEGQRNTTMHHYALRVLTRYGADDETAYRAFINKSQRCSPPLGNLELDSIWNGAVAYYNSHIKTSADYILPELYNIGVPRIHFELPVVDYKALSTIATVREDDRYFNIEIGREFLKAFGIKIRYNEMSHDYEIATQSPVINGENSFELLVTLLEDTIAKLAYKRGRKILICDFLNFIANENCYHPVVDLLKKEPWDCTDRLPELYQMMDLSDEFHMTLVRKWLLQTVAILFNTKEKPISTQGILVLQGGQGIGKTEFFRHLAIKDDFFKGGAVLDMRNKDTIISSTRVWICELGEIDSTTNKKQSELKSFITEPYDRYREPYARKEVQRIRKTSFCGTVNPSAYLTDETGNRRYWTVSVKNMDVGSIFAHTSEWYTQLWRQILCEYNRNPKGYLLTKEEQDTVNRSNEKYETLLQGEDEFMTVFDTSADYSLWTNRLTAAQIADELNSRFKSLHISSMSVGKNLIPRIEKRTSKQFERKTIRGRNFILCPPFAEDKTYETPILPDYPATDKT